jgi:acyl-coenzyme A synthetase/AMP-(fatty) acid ligase
VVPIAPDDRRDLTALIGQCLESSVGRFFLLPLRDLPLTESGKVRRQALKDMFAAIIPPS